MIFVRLFAFFLQLFDEYLDLMIIHFLVIIVLMQCSLFGLHDYLNHLVIIWFLII
jgi:hypothetical protein